MADIASHIQDLMFPDCDDLRTDPYLNLTGQHIYDLTEFMGMKEMDIRLVVIRDIVDMQINPQQRNPGGKAFDTPQ